MSHYTHGLAHSITQGGTSLNIDRTDPGSLLIGNNAGSFELNQLTAGTGVSIVNGDGTITISATGTYTLPIASSSVLGGIKVGTGLSIALDGTLSAMTSGTITSVGLSAPGEFTVTGSPVTGPIGTLSFSWNSEAANLVLASPSGSSGIPSFRALTAVDIPNLDASKITSGILTNSRGGTGLNSSTAGNGQLLIGTGTGLILATLTAGTNISITNTSGGIKIDNTFTEIIYAPLVNGDLPGPSAIADEFGAFIMVAT